MDFRERIQGILSKSLTACGIEILQVNLGYKCNMGCKHCHIDAGPCRDEVMDRENIGVVLDVLRENEIPVIDITGGAPELNPHFRFLVEEAGKTGAHVIVRTNLTIFFEEGMEDLPEFLGNNMIEVIASLPYYLERDVDRVRGNGTFQKSIRALKKLNSLGYGENRPEEKLNLVYNPAGTFLPPPQKTLEEDYKRELRNRFGISFDSLFTFTNMPVGRFRDFLSRTGSLEHYMEKLSVAFNAHTLDGVMCRHLINVGWNGKLYDCDFNQILGLDIDNNCPAHINDFNYSNLASREITLDNHCYGCTAGQGST